eukprot:gene25660-20006_t
MPVMAGLKQGNCHGCIRSKFLPIDNNGKGFPKPRKDTVDVDADYGQIVAGGPYDGENGMCYGDHGEKIRAPHAGYNGGIMEC